MPETPERFGGHSGGETPGPIPNPEVKPSSADGTAREAGWESRSPPRLFTKRRHRAALRRIRGRIWRRCRVRVPAGSGKMRPVEDNQARPGRPTPSGRRSAGGLPCMFSALGGTRTPNLLIRSQMLSPIELRAPEVGRASLPEGRRRGRSDDGGSALALHQSSLI